jgi:hypothetical protein
MREKKKQNKAKTEIEKSGRRGRREIQKKRKGLG